MSSSRWIVFESNREYVNQVLATQVDLEPYNMEFVNRHDLPQDWFSFEYREKVNAGGVPSEQVAEVGRIAAREVAESRG